MIMKNNIDNYYDKLLFCAMEFNICKLKKGTVSKSIWWVNLNLRVVSASYRFWLNKMFQYGSKYGFNMASQPESA